MYDGKHVRSDESSHSFMANAHIPIAVYWIPYFIAALPAPE